MSNRFLLKDHTYRSLRTEVSTLGALQKHGRSTAFIKKGKGSLCSTIVTFSEHVAKEYVVGAATHHGRILVLNRQNAKESTAMVLRYLSLYTVVRTYWWRRRNGRGAWSKTLYMQRAAVQGSPDSITKITQCTGMQNKPGDRIRLENISRNYRLRQCPYSPATN
jgi:hypothetical protein